MGLRVTATPDGPFPTLMALTLPVVVDHRHRVVVEVGYAGAALASPPPRR